MDEKHLSDSDIVEKLYRRDTGALDDISEKYEALFRRIAVNILISPHDAEECVNDVYLKLWNSIPPARPINLASYGAKAVRNTALNMYKAGKASRRFSGDVLSELDECVPDVMSEKPFSDVDSGMNELGIHIDTFLRALDRETRVMFVMRYFYCDPEKKIAKKLALSEQAVKSRLFRTREKLKKYLTEKGVTI